MLAVAARPTVDLRARQWLATAFHEDPQEAAYVDGRRAGGAGGADDAEEDFRAIDGDGDGFLTLDEARGARAARGGAPAQPEQRASAGLAAASASGRKT